MQRWIADRLTTKIWQLLKAAQRAVRFEEMTTCGLWRSVGKKKAIAEGYVPAISTSASIRDIVPVMQHASVSQLPELYDLRKLVGFVSSDLRKHNDEVMMEGLKAEVNNRNRKGRGRLSKDMQTSLDAWTERLRKHESFVNTCRDWSAKAREQNSNESLIQADMDVHILAGYQYKYDWRGRRTVRDLGYQRMPRRMLWSVAPDTLEDWDIKCAQWSILSQLVRKLRIRLAHPVTNFSFVHGYAADPESHLNKFRPLLGVDVKHELLMILGGKAIPESAAENVELQELAQEARFLRWLAISLLPEVYDSEAIQGKEWPEASVLAALWMAAEDWILQAWQEFVSSESYSHLSLHFDGIIVDGDRVQKSGQDFGLESSRAIETRTGFRPVIRRKMHKNIGQLIREHAVEKIDLAQGRADLAALDRKGNCVPLALAHLLNRYDEAKEFVLMKGVLNLKARTEQARTYASCTPLADGHSVHPAIGLPNGEASFLLHHCTGSSFHCVAVKTEKDSVIVYDGFEGLRLSAEGFRQAAHEAYDSKEIVTFTLQDSSVEEDPKLRALFELKAGASDEGSDSDNCSEVEDLEPCEMLLSSLEKELRQALTEVEDEGETRACPLCPFRAFDRTARVLHHLRTYHTRKVRFCPGGSKQFRLLLALWDHDSAAGLPNGGNYLARSAAEMRRTVRPPLPANCMGPRADKQVRLLFTNQAQKSETAL